MRILMLGWEFPPKRGGGVGVACHGIATALAYQNHEVTFLLPRILGEAQRNYKVVTPEGLNFDVACVDSPLTADMTADEYQHLSAEEKKRFGQTLFAEVLRFGQAVKGFLKGQQFDLIHAHDWLTFPAGQAAKEALGVPLVAHVHLTGYEQTAGQGIDPRVLAVEKLGFKAADHIITVSRRTKRVLVEQYGVKDQKVSVIYNGVTMLPDLDHITPSIKARFADKKLVVFVGRLTMHKGPDYFIRAAEFVLKKRNDVLFVMAGAGELEYQMVRLAASLGVGEHVLFAGFLRDRALSELYKSAALYVMSSVHDPFGITALEALQHGTPALVSKQTGASEALANVLKVDFWDTRQMAATILATLEYDALGKTLAREGTKEVQKFTWDNAARQILGVYSQLTPALATS